jgi:phenylpropionate dioxygenase-like ring-hydroxylating dioxygenase large terminal subunit
MFTGFANVWTVIGLARDFPARRLHARQVAGEKIVLFRDEKGMLSALLDKCPHRGVALSIGKLNDGVVECPFHGWCFDSAGACTRVPWNPDAKRENLSATALPVREAGGLVWLHTGLDPQDEPEISATLLDPRVVLCRQSVRWRVHWTRAMENMLDSPHLPFVHKGSIGRGLAKLVATRRMDVTWTPVDYGARVENTVEGRDSTARLDYRFPNAMELFIDPPGKTFRMLAVCLPESDTHTLMCIYTMRDFMRSRMFNPLFAWSNGRIAREDQAVLETSNPPMVPPAGQEKSVRTDAPTLAFRKLWFERLKNSEA